MKFDDRLKTAIMQPVVDDHDRIVRWRQVVDLLSRTPAHHDEAIVDAGFALVERDAAAVPEAARAATARAVSGRAIDRRLLSFFARDSLAVAAPLLAAAQLGSAELARIARDASPDVASFARSLVAGLERIPANAPTDEIDLNSGVGDHDPLFEPSISQMVARIEQLRNRRAGDTAPPQPVNESSEVPSPAVPHRRAVLEDRPDQSTSSRGGATDGSVFRWESDAAGQIAWVEGAPRGAMIGNQLLTVSNDEALAKAISSREPFGGTSARFDVPSIEGEWTLSGIPAFSPRDGRFLGYRGVARKSEPALSTGARPALARPAPTARDLDSLRETIHEIKTPLNAIIGFAEIIDGQYLGPAHRNYRQRAAGIVAQARTLLEAIEDMEFVARMQSAPGGAPAAHWGDFFPQVAEDLRRQAERAGVRLTIIPPPNSAPCVLSPELAVRLLRRFVGSVLNAAEAGEQITVDVACTIDECRLSVSRPSRISNFDETMLLAPGLEEESETAILGLGFAIRLVRGLSRLFGGELSFEPDAILLRIPSR